MIQALAGLRVLDLTHGALAYAPSLLASLGADLQEVDAGSSDAEAPKLWTALGPDAAERLRQLERPELRERIRALAGDVDVVCESFAPGRLREHGLDFEDLAAAHPRLVWASITPFGRSGPRRDWRSSNLIAYAMSGLLPAIGDPDRAPLRPGGPIPLAELLAAVQAAAGILLAIRARRSTGRGQLVDVSVHATAVASSSELGITGFLDDLIPRRRMGNRRRQLAPSGLYACKDGFAAVIILPVAHWDALARWIHERTGNEAVLDPMFRDVVARAETAELLEGWVEELARLYTKQELFEEGQRRGIAITPLNHLSDLPRDPHLAARRWWRELDHPERGRVPVAGAPFRFRRPP